MHACCLFSSGLYVISFLHACSVSDDDLYALNGVKIKRSGLISIEAVGIIHW